MAMSDVHLEPPKPRKKMPAYIKIQPEIRSSSMFTAMVASANIMPALSTTPTKLSIGLQPDRLETACFQIMKPISTTPEGDRPAVPAALSPI
ncbi:hypothetical protein D3C84_679740 [compost metagenome]